MVLEATVGVVEVDVGGAGSPIGARHLLALVVQVGEGEPCAGPQAFTVIRPWVSRTVCVPAGAERQVPQR